MTGSWDELWGEINWARVTTIPFITERIHAIRAEGDRLQSAITQINECIGEYESKEWCGHCPADSKCAQITLAVNELKEKAEKWDLADKIGPPPHGDKRIQWHIDMSELRLKLEDVREFVISRRRDIEQDMENFGILKPVLNYFLEEARAP